MGVDGCRCYGLVFNVNKHSGNASENTCIWYFQVNILAFCRCKCIGLWSEIGVDWGFKRCGKEWVNMGCLWERWGGLRGVLGVRRERFGSSEI